MGFELGRKYVRLAALNATFLTKTVEVEILAFGECERKRAPAAAAELPLEVVVVTTLPDPSGVVECENLLNAGEECGVDERLVAPVVLDIAVRHLPDVETAAKKLDEAAARDRLRRTRVRATDAKPLVIQQVTEFEEGVVARRVELEGETDEVRLFLMDDGAGDPSTLDGLALGAVSEREPTRVAALSNPLEHAFPHLGGEVGTVELSHRGVDRLNEPPRCCFLDPFSDGDEAHVDLFKRCADRDMPLHASGETVELVHDENLDLRLFAKALEHVLERRPME